MNNKPVITVVGRIMKEPDLRFSAQGEPVTTLSLALYTGGSKAKGYKPSFFVRVTAWGELAEFANSLAKMQVIEVRGTPQPPRTYEKDGEVRSAGLEVTANEIDLGDAFKEN